MLFCLESQRESPEGSPFLLGYLPSLERSGWFTGWSHEQRPPLLSRFRLRALFRFRIHGGRAALLVDEKKENSMKFEVGKSYKTRDGRKVTITKICPDMIFPLVGLVEGELSEEIWTSDGSYSSYTSVSLDLDLVAEWKDPDSVGVATGSMPSPLNDIFLESQREKKKRRDEFAKAAMQGILADQQYTIDSDTLMRERNQAIVNRSVDLADALIEALDRRAEK